MGRLIPIGSLRDITPERVRELRARIDARRDVYDAATGTLEEPSASPLTALMPSGVAALAERVKWQTWLALAAGALITLIVGALVWWWTRQSEAESKRKASLARARIAARQKR